jgi:hypothetical protein
MKKMTGTLPDELRSEIDFSYLEGLGEQEQRAATFYEYARHCEPIKEFVAELRQAGAFKVGKLSPELALRVASMKYILRQEQLLGLVVSEGFPEKPYRDSKTGRGLFESKQNFYGIDVLSCIPWRALRLGSGKNQNSEDAVYLGGCYESRTIHAISVPWKYTNRELAKMFFDLLAGLRPGHLPEPKKAGRKGRSEKFGTRDMLNQLKAYRLSKNGFNYLASEKLYTSPQAWRKAVNAATKRISRMMLDPFFG